MAQRATKIQHRRTAAALPLVRSEMEERTEQRLLLSPPSPPMALHPQRLHS
jgi:hypothetical protein